MEALAAERERGGAYRGIAELASRSGAGPGEPRKAGLGGGARRHPGRRRRRAPRGALAGRGDRGRADERRGDPAGAAARAAGAAGAGAARRVGQADRRLPEHRPHPGTAPAGDAAAGARPEDPPLLGPEKTARDDSVVEVAGMVVARQRPETANGIVFMLLEDERGTVNLIVPPPVYDRHRALVRAAPLLRREGQAGAPRGGDQRDRDQGLGAGAHREDGRLTGAPVAARTADRHEPRRPSPVPRARRRRAPRRGAGRPQLRPPARPAHASFAASSRGRPSPPRRCRRRGRGRTRSGRGGATRAPRSGRRRCDGRRARPCRRPALPRSSRRGV